MLLQGQCKNLGGYLVKITDSAENAWVVDMMKSKLIVYFMTLNCITHIYILEPQLNFDLRRLF